MIYPKREMVRFSERTTQATADMEGEHKNLKDDQQKTKLNRKRCLKKKKKKMSANLVKNNLECYY